MKRRLADLAASSYSESGAAIRTGQKMSCPLTKMVCHFNAIQVAHRAIGIEPARRGSCVRNGFGAVAYMQIAAPDRVRLTDYSEVMRHIEIVDNGV
ncbi:hypothetical protein B0O95_10151 [Mycetohabitans endofungorum]|uniref:Uncharacterized protein n=1 Tax=Mycetohabitans endofungorum TaxID=417203 RepID=A0A2P5KE50_9BURK|nr:hypothetical protein B0O95_10151 [Mycetohabitans endofungorum]